MGRKFLACILPGKWKHKTSKGHNQAGGDACCKGVPSRMSGTGHSGHTAEPSSHTELDSHCDTASFTDLASSDTVSNRDMVLSWTSNGKSHKSVVGGLSSSQAKQGSATQACKLIDTRAFSATRSTPLSLAGDRGMKSTLPPAVPQTQHMVTISVRPCNRLAVQSADGSTCGMNMASGSRISSPGPARQSSSALASAATADVSVIQPRRAVPPAGGMGPSRLGPALQGSSGSSTSMKISTAVHRAYQSHIAKDGTMTMSAQTSPRHSPRTPDMRPGSPGPHIPQCLTRAYASSSQLPLEDGQAGNAWAEGVPGQKVPKNVPFAKLLHTDKKGQLLHSATMLKGSGHQARPMGPLGGQSERMLDPGCADDYMIAAIKPSPEGQSLHNSFQELDSVLSPTTMRLRAQSSGLLHVSRMLPPGLEGEESWWLSSFSLKQRLYKGYASSVYAATHKASGLVVALKVYQLADLPEMLLHQCFREVDVHRGLQNVNILELYAAFVEGTRLVLVLEYAAGGDLASVWKKFGHQATEQHVAQHIILPMLQALSYLHRLNIAHRDIKPANIFFAEEDTLKLADFGVAIDIAAEAAVTHTGTGPYMAPEVQRTPFKRTAEENKSEQALMYDMSADIWSLGMMAYELLVGLKPDVTALRMSADAIAAEDARAQINSPSSPIDGTSKKARLAQKMAFLLPFPQRVSGAARDFVLCALRPLPHERLTAQQLLQHDWIGPWIEEPMRTEEGDEEDWPCGHLAGELDSVQGDAGKSSGPALGRSAAVACNTVAPSNAARPNLSKSLTLTDALRAFTKRRPSSRAASLFGS